MIKGHPDIRKNPKHKAWLDGKPLADYMYQVKDGEITLNPRVQFQHGQKIVVEEHNGKLAGKDVFVRHIIGTHMVIEKDGSSRSYPIAIPDKQEHT